MLVEAAQHLDKHPGPLGVFFRRIAKKKSRNVAVVATARKLVTIAWAAPGPCPRSTPYANAKNCRRAPRREKRACWKRTE